MENQTLHTFPNISCLLSMYPNISSQFFMVDISVKSSKSWNIIPPSICSFSQRYSTMSVQENARVVNYTWVHDTANKIGAWYSLFSQAVDNPQFGASHKIGFPSYLPWKTTFGILTIWPGSLNELVSWAKQALNKAWGWGCNCLGGWGCWLVVYNCNKIRSHHWTTATELGRVK